MIAYNDTKKTTIASRVEKALSARSRMKGLLGRSSIESDYGMWFEPGKSIHTFFMKFPIDVIFLSSSHQVVKLYENMKPFRMSTLVWSARSVIELAPYTIRKSQTSIGDKVTFTI